MVTFISNILLQSPLSAIIEKGRILLGRDANGFTNVTVSNSVFHRFALAMAKLANSRNNIKISSPKYCQQAKRLYRFSKGAVLGI